MPIEPEVNSVPGPWPILNLGAMGVLHGASYNVPYVDQFGNVATDQTVSVDVLNDQTSSQVMGNGVAPILAYLTDVWTATCRPKPDSIPGPGTFILGSGSVSTGQIA